MRLVDSDALTESFENVLGAAPCELNGYEIWEVLNAQECIDAIPVEWLKAHIRPYHGDAGDIGLTARNGTIKNLIREWQKEQEARNESKV